MKKKYFLLSLFLLPLSSCFSLNSSSIVSDSSSISHISIPVSTVINSSFVASSSDTLSTSNIDVPTLSIPSSSSIFNGPIYKLAAPIVDSDSFEIPYSDKTIFKGEQYVDVEEVAAYVMAFKELPVNYVLNKSSADKRTCSDTYGEMCRLYKYPYKNDNSGRYTSPYLTDGATDYFEADVGDEEGNYNPFSRGKYRIVFSVQEDHQIVYYTDDHYDHYQEYLNYYQGWGPWFGDKPTETHNFSCKWQPGIVVSSIPGK